MSAISDRPTRGIDHLVVAARDLDRAEAQYRRLGFALTPRGHHSKLGSSNHCAMLPGGDYLELLALGRERGLRAYYEQFLARREGAAGIAFRTGNARATFDALAARGFQPEEPIAFGRPVEIDGKRRDARFVTVSTDPEIPFGARVFFCEHETPELVWLPSYLAQPNGAQALISVTLVSEGPELGALFGRMLDLRPEAGADATVIETGAQRIEIPSPKAATARYGNDPLLAARPPYAAAIRLAVADVAATERLLRANGVSCRWSTRGTLLVPSTEATGIMLEFG